jgi:hypothetical protein
MPTAASLVRSRCAVMAIKKSQREAHVYRLRQPITHTMHNATRPRKEAI